ncbi:MAG: plasmid pRiA4b ORF-3 family protein [Niabella sp.]
MSFVFKIKLDGSSRPSIWRKIVVGESISFRRLHLVIQAAMGWQNTHPYEFSLSDISSPWQITEKCTDSEDVKPFVKSSLWGLEKGKFDAAKIKVNQFFNTVRQKLVYIYDFDDNWWHIVELVEIRPDQLSRAFCLDGRGTCPPESCNGVGGYYFMVDAINNPQHPGHRSMMRWIGLMETETWNLDRFGNDEIADVNHDLKIL